MLTPGFILGVLDALDDFWLLADVVLPDEKAPYLSGRFYDRRGGLILHLQGKEILENPGNCLIQSSAEDFRLVYPSGEEFLALHTEIFTNGYMSRIQGKLYDRMGSLRMEPSFGSAKVFGDAQWAIPAPARFQNKASFLSFPSDFSP